MAEAQNNKKNYEVTDAKTRAIAWGGVILTALMVFAFILVMVVFNLFENKTRDLPVSQSPLMQSRQLPDSPRLQVDPELDLAQYRALEDSLINSYGWIQREAGVIHIPIDEAMTQMLQRGFPVRPGYREHERGMEK